MTATTASIAPTTPPTVAPMVAELSGDFSKIMFLNQLWKHAVHIHTYACHYRCQIHGLVTCKLRILIHIIITYLPIIVLVY